MFKHILVPTDLTDRTEKALEIAVNLSVRQGGKVTLMHVVETIHDTEGDEFDAFYKKLGRKAQKKMGKFIDLHRSSDPSIAQEIVYGRRIPSIIGYAMDHEVDLIVLASHKVNMEDASKGWGTISYKVSVLSHCPVMLVK